MSRTQSLRVPPDQTPAARLRRGEAVVLAEKPGAHAGEGFGVAVMLALLGFLGACTLYLAIDGVLVGTLVMGSILLGFGTILWLILGETILQRIGRWRGRPALRIDRDGLSGTLLEVPGRHLAWTDLQEASANHHGLFGALAIALTAASAKTRNRSLWQRLNVTKTTYEHELLVHDYLFELPASEVAALINLGIQIYGRETRFEPKPDLRTSEQQRHDTQLAAIARGETVEIKGSKRAGLGYAVLALILIAGDYFLFIWPCILLWDEHGWKRNGALATIAAMAVVLAPVMLYLTRFAIQSAIGARRDGTVYRIGPAGIEDLRGATLRRTVPWSAVRGTGIMYGEGVDATTLKVDNQTYYQAFMEGWLGRYVLWQQGWVLHTKDIPLETPKGPNAARHLGALIEAGRRRWSGTPARPALR